MTRQVVIQNPVINSPFREPARHFRFDDEGITDRIDLGRRISSYFIPIAQPKKNNGPLNTGALPRPGLSGRFAAGDSSPNSTTGRQPDCLGRDFAELSVAGASG